MENRISLHELRFYAAITEGVPQWMTSADLAKKAAISPRAARAYATKFAKLGILDVASVFPARRYRLAVKPPSSSDYVKRLEQFMEMEIK